MPKLNPIEEKKEGDEKEPESPKEEATPPIVTEKEAKYVLDEITDICQIFQSTTSLTAATQIEKTPSFYLEEILRVLKNYSILVD